MDKVLFEHLLSILLGINLGVGSQGFMVILHLTYWRTTKLLSTALATFTFLPATGEGVGGKSTAHTGGAPQCGGELGAARHYRAEAIGTVPTLPYNMPYRTRLPNLPLPAPGLSPERFSPSGTALHPYTGQTGSARELTSLVASLKE